MPRKATTDGASTLVPRISDSSRFYHRRPPPEEDTRCRRRGRNDGKLAQLMDLPVDIFFEITSKLKPLDLLQLSRVSKYFRQTFTSKSSRMLWIAARKNASSLPDPPEYVSEPRYAAVVFEHICFACGVGRSPKVDYALCVRFCGACWKANVKKGNTLLRAHRGVDEEVLKLIPREYYLYSSVEPSSNGSWNNFYVPEFESIASHYMSMNPTDRATYAEERHKYVLAMHEHAKAVIEWEVRVRQEQVAEGSRAQKNRQESIEQKLIEMGYTKEEFPPVWSSEWAPLVNQPRELTPRIWKQIQPKLVQAIQAHKEKLIKQEIDARKRLRKSELTALYQAYVESLPDDIGPVPTCDELLAIEPIKSLAEEDDSRVTFSQERFDRSVPAAVETFCIRARQELVDVLLKRKQEDIASAYVEKSLIKDLKLIQKSEISERLCRAVCGIATKQDSATIMKDGARFDSDMVTSDWSTGSTSSAEQTPVPVQAEKSTEDLAETDVERWKQVLHAFPVYIGPKITEILTAASEDAAFETALAEISNATATPDELLMATCFFRCNGCTYYENRSAMAFLDLKDHTCFNHIRNSRRISGDAYCVSVRHRTKAQEVLKVLGLPEDTKHADVSGKVACLCRKPRFEQPATFSKLITHLLDEEDEFTRLNQRRHPGDITDIVIYNNHNLSGEEPVLKLIAEGEEVPVFEPLNDDNGNITVLNYGKCKICERYVGQTWYSGQRYYSADDFIYHVRARHHREPTADDMAL